MKHVYPGGASLKLFALLAALATVVMLSVAGITAAETLEGTVTDAVTGNPLYGASVRLVRSGAAAMAGRDGRYLLTGLRAGGDTLVCSMIGYRSSRSAVTIPDTVDITLRPEPPEMATIEVRAPSPDEVPLAERTSATVTVIGGEDIPERSATLDDILDRQAGIDIRSTGGVGSRSDISIRGSTTEQVTVYLDGIPVTASGSGISGLAAIPVSQVERVEVYRGSSPGAFGPGAIGGVVSVTTAPPDSALSARGSTSYGSFGTNHQAFSGTFGNTGMGMASLSFSRHASDNDFEYYDDRGTTINTADDGWETRRNGDYLAEHYAGAWHGRFGDDHDVTVRGGYLETVRGVPGLGRRPALHARLSSDMILLQSRHTFKSAVETRGWFTREKRIFHDPEDEAGRRGRQDNLSTVEVLGATSTGTWVRGPVLARFNAELRREEYNARDRYYESAVGLPSTRSWLSGGIETEIMLMGGDMWIDPRVQYIHVDDRIEEESILLASLPDAGVTHASRDLATYALGWRWKPADILTVRASAGSYARMPEFDELFGDTGDIVGNTALEEERSVNLDAGMLLSGDDLPVTFDIAVFRRTSRDLIQRRSYGDYLIAENIGRALIMGVETWAAGDARDGRLTWRASLAWQDARNRSDGTLYRKRRYYDKYLPYHPSWQGDAAIRHRFPGIRARLGWSMHYESSCYKGPSNLDEEKLDARVIHDVEAGVRLHTSLELVLDVRNIGDDRATDRWGYPKPGRGYYLTLSWNYERRSGN